MVCEDPQRRLDAREVNTLAHQVSLVRHVLENSHCAECSSQTKSALAYLTIRESAAAAIEFRKIIDHKGATWAALRAGPAWSTAAQAGDSARAKQAYSDFFTFGKTPTRTFQFCWKPGRNTRRLKFSSEV